MKRIIIVLFALFLTACATAGGGDATKSNLAVATHTDLLAAAKRATDNGWPARANVWLAFDTLLTAKENQATACLAAIKASMPKAPRGTVAGPFEAIEIGAEAVGGFQGVPAAVKLNCTALPIPPLPTLPKLPG